STLFSALPEGTLLTHRVYLFPYHALFRSRARSVLATNEPSSANSALIRTHSCTETRARLPLAASRATARASLCMNGSELRRNWRSEEHTSELQSRLHLACRLLLEKKK